VTALKEKLSKDKDATKPEADESVVEPKSRSHAGAATAAGVGGAAAGGAVIADAATKNEAPASTTAEENEFLPVAPVEQGPAPTATATSEESGFLPVAQVDPTQPATHSEPATTSSAATSVPTISEPEAEKADAIPFEQQGALSRFSNDAVPTLSTTRPDLERHISQIPENDDDEDDDDEDIIAAVAKTTKPQPETVEEPQTRAGKIGAAIAKGVAPMASSFGPTVPYHETAAVKEDDGKAVAQTKAVDDKVRNVLADNTAPLASAFAPVAAVKTSHANEGASDPLEEQRYEPEQQQAGPTVVGSGGSIAKDESTRPGTADTVKPADAGESDKKGLKGFFSKLKPKSGKETSEKEKEKEKEKLPEFKTVAKKDKEAAAAAPAKPASEEKVAALAAVPVSTPAATGTISEASSVPGNITTWQTTQPEIAPSQLAHHTSSPSNGSVNPPTIVNANTASPAPVTTSSAAKPTAPATTAPAPTVAAIDATTEAGIVPGTISTWQKPSPLPEQPGQTSAIPATNPTHTSAAPTTATLANTATPATHDEHTEDDEDHPSRTSRLAAALGLKPKQDRNKLHKRALDEQPARSASVADETEDDEDFYDADQGVTPTGEKPPASALTGAGGERKETKFVENL
jgi:hypothetical protein